MSDVISTYIDIVSCYFSNGLAKCPIVTGKGIAIQSFKVDRAQLAGPLIAVIGHLNILPN